VVAALDLHEPGAPAKPRDRLGQEVGLGKGVARPLEEEHGDGHLREMVAAQLLGTPGRVEGIAEKDQRIGGHPLGHRHRRDPPPERLSSGHERKARPLRDRGPRDGAEIGAGLAPAVAEFVAEVVAGAS